MIFTDSKINWMVAEWLKDPESLFMTSRVVKEGEELWFGAEEEKDTLDDKAGKELVGDREFAFSIPTVVKMRREYTASKDVYSEWARVKWQVGRSYAIQLGRRRQAVCLDTELLGQPGHRALRMLVVDLRGPERLLGITEEDAKMEGFGVGGIERESLGDTARKRFLTYWWRLYPKGESNPLTWRITFRLETV